MHCCALLSSINSQCLSSRIIFTLGKSQKSHGAKLGEWNGLVNITKFLFVIQELMRGRRNNISFFRIIFYVYCFLDSLIRHMKVENITLILHIDQRAFFSKKKINWYFFLKKKTRAVINIFIWFMIHDSGYTWKHTL